MERGQSPDTPHHVVAVTDAAGGTSCEGFLQELWRRLLKVEHVDAESDFFALGGRSLLLVEMLVAVSKRYGSEIDYDAFFSNPTLEELKAVLEPHS